MPITGRSAVRIGFVGAGRMGRPMVGRLIRAGHQVHVPARTPEARETLKREGARTVARAADAGAEADAVLVCVYDDDQVREVCLRGGLLSRMPEGSILVLHTTGSPDTAEAVAARASSRSVEVIDAPVSGGPHDAGAGRLTLFAGGSTGAVARVRPVLSAYGDPILHVGPLGAGQRVKLINNALFAAQLGLLADAVRVAARLGVDEPTLLTALPHGSAASRALAATAARGSVAAFAEAVTGFLAKDVAVARRIAADHEAALGSLHTALTTLAALLPDPPGKRPR